MILFAEDWAKYPSAIPDYDTTNKSFLEYCSLLHTMGVENCLWPISLLQPELVGVDPFDENLSAYHMAMIIIECRYNPWYFLREIVRFKPSGSVEPMQYKANRGNMSVAWSFMAGVDPASIQPRQTGKSGSSDSLALWFMFCRCTNTLMALFTKDGGLRAENIERIKEMRDLLPPYIYEYSRIDANNTVEITNNKLNNHYKTFIAQPVKMRANNVGRGNAIQINNIDELPFIVNGEVSVNALLSAGNAARDQAKRAGAPNGTIFTTTAGDIETPSGKYAYELISGGAPWQEFFFDAKDKEDYRTLVKTNMTGKRLLVNCTFNHLQLGYTDEWLYEKLTYSTAKREDADKDYFNQWSRGGSSNLLSKELIKVINASEALPVYVERFNKYLVNWYITKDELELRESIGRSFVMGMDTSEATGDDGISGVVLDSSDLSVIGTFNCNETNLMTFMAFVADFLIKHLTVTLIPERRSTGGVLLDSLVIALPLHGIDPFKRIFNTIVENRYSDPEQYKLLQTPLHKRDEAFYDTRKKAFGFATTGAKRSQLYDDILMDKLNATGHLLRDRTLTGQIKGLTVKNRRIDHASGGHDDSVIAWLLGHWLLYIGKNLDHYGIDSSRVNIFRVKVQATDENAIKAQQQAVLQEKIKNLIIAIDNESNEVMIMRLQNQVSKLMTQVDEAYADVTSLDQLLKTAIAKKKERIKNTQINRKSDSYNNATDLRGMVNRVFNSIKNRAA